MAFDDSGGGRYAFLSGGRLARTWATRLRGLTCSYLTNFFFYETYTLFVIDCQNKMLSDLSQSFGVIAVSTGSVLPLRSDIPTPVII